MGLITFSVTYIHSVYVPQSLSVVHNTQEELCPAVTAAADLFTFPLSSIRADPPVKWFCPYQLNIQHRYQICLLKILTHIFPIYFFISSRVQNDPHLTLKTCLKLKIKPKETIVSSGHMCCIFIFIFFPYLCIGKFVIIS